MKLLLTRELGRLARWLRILGIDAAYTKETNLSTVIMQALREDRSIVTRNHRMPASRGIVIVTLRSETLKEELSEALTALAIPPEKLTMFSRCTICNVELVKVPKDQLKDKVPEYVWQTQHDFHSCPVCKRIYWQGTHWGNVKELLDQIKR